MSPGSLQIVSTTLPLSVTVPSNDSSIRVRVDRVRTPMEEFTETITDSLLHILVPLIASDSNEAVDARFMKYLPPHRRKRGYTVNKICRLYVAFAKTYYRNGAGKITSEAGCIAYALKPLKKLYGGTRIADLGPRRLKAVRDLMITFGCPLPRAVARPRCNSGCRCKRRCWSWKRSPTGRPILRRRCQRLLVIGVSSHYGTGILRGIVA